MLVSKELWLHETMMVCVYDACEGHVERSHFHLMNSHVVFLGQVCSCQQTEVVLNSLERRII